MASPFCCFRNPLPWFAVLAPLLISTGFWGFGFSSVLLTSTVLVLSTVHCAFSKHKPVVAVSREEVLGSEEAESSPQMEGVVSEPHPESETKTQEEEAQDGLSHEIHDHLVTSLYSLSENTECLYRLSTSEESEVDWPFRENVDQSPDYSDGSISDEESLIEIALPSGHYVSNQEEKPKVNKQQKVPDFSAESIFQPRYLLDQILSEINEMNEEENLIEIDISMGSIKCSRFEIEA
ncbi:hypothetical protein CJ030_MR6G003667 [Morella rubra]|uniref:Uncharacterized protein n=1 Tax=Morella rubra TaxID=262757 RepID=A0A6A1V980_9ROSI|nr:hypothetical protein CJ030_MR6G003667 [Morella rubra]